MNIRGTKGTPVKVKWINNDPRHPPLLPPAAELQLAVRHRPHAHGHEGRGPGSNGVNPFGGEQQADNAMVVHFHGGEIPPNSDGFAELWFGNATSAAVYSPGNAAQADRPPARLASAARR